MEKKTSKRAIFIVWRWEEPLEGLWHSTGDNSHLYCILEKNLFEENMDFIVSQLETYAVLPQCMIFLHRKRHPHSYVEELLKFVPGKLKYKDKGKLKCFLFGDGNDYLYLTQNPNGLLGSGELGGWVELQDGRTEEYKVAENTTERIIRQENYDSVWNYYQHEFKKKLYLLERDLFIHFGHFTDVASSKRDISLYTHLKTSEPLNLRLRSFIGLRIKEEKNAKSNDLLFDDCSENLKSVYGMEASKVYEELKQSIDKVFLGNSLNKIQPHLDILRVREQFIQLRSLMPERITY